MNTEVDIKGHNFAGSQEINTEYYILLTYQLHVPVLCVDWSPGQTAREHSHLPWDGTGLMLKILLLQVVSHIKGKPLLCAESQKSIFQFKYSNAF